MGVDFFKMPGKVDSCVNSGKGNLQGFEGNKMGLRCK